MVVSRLGSGRTINRKSGRFWQSILVYIIPASRRVQRLMVIRRTGLVSQHSGFDNLGRVDVGTVTRAVG